MNVSDMKPPTMASRNAEPMKFVRVFAAPERLKFKTVKKYRKKHTTLEINPMFSNADNPSTKENDIS